MTPQDRLRQLPPVDRLLKQPTARNLIDQYGYDSVLDSVRDVLSKLRTDILAGSTPAIDHESILQNAKDVLDKLFIPTLRPVINATGVIIHTNLGRALLSKMAQQAMTAVANQYNTLEFELETGKRGSRLIHAAALLRDLTGAEDALVVNNNAAALVLLLSALARRREVIVSRGQLVEIGGGFRIPDIMAQSGATLVEVGTTNRTRIADYARAITADTALLMRIHSSNFKLVGFTEEAALSEMVQLAGESGLYCVDDLGSGTLLDTQPYGLDHEPTVQESLAAGADLVSFSGDKLLGGPQAGILVGRSSIIDELKHHPLARALRVDKLTYAALTATLDHYRKGEATTHIPVWQMISRPLDSIRETAERWAQQTGGQVVMGESTVGGGSLPGTTLPTALLALDVDSASAFMAALRAGSPPVIARVMDDRVLFDPRTVLPEQEADLLTAIQNSQTSN